MPETLKEQLNRSFSEFTDSLRDHRFGEPLPPLKLPDRISRCRIPDPPYIIDQSEGKEILQ